MNHAPVEKRKIPKTLFRLIANHAPPGKIASTLAQSVVGLYRAGLSCYYCHPIPVDSVPSDTQSDRTPTVPKSTSIKTLRLPGLMPYFTGLYDIP